MVICDIVLHPEKIAKKMVQLMQWNETMRQ